MNPRSLLITDGLKKQREKGFIYKKRFFGFKGQYYSFNDSIDFIPTKTSKMNSQSK